MYKDHSRYTGEWKENKKHGKGTIEYADMTGWKGEWKMNLKHGTGQAFNRARVMRTEKYENDKLVWKEADKHITEVPSVGNFVLENRHDSLMEFGEKLLNFMGYEYDNPSKWTIKDVSMFLKHQKLERYDNLFVENEIDGESLLKISENDLKQMGIGAKGHRIRLREAIKKLRKMTKSEIRKKLKENEIKNKKISSLIHPESMDQKILSYYDKLDIVEEGNASSEGSKITETNNVMNSLSPYGKLSTSNSKMNSASKLEASNVDITSFGLSPMKPLTKRSQSFEPKNLKRRTYSDNDIQMESITPKFHDDNFLVNDIKNDDLSIIQEKDLDIISENVGVHLDELDMEDENGRNCDSIIVQPTTSSVKKFIKKLEFFFIF